MSGYLYNAQLKSLVGSIKNADKCLNLTNAIPVDNVSSSGAHPLMRLTFPVERGSEKALRRIGASVTKTLRENFKLSEK